MSMGLPMNQTGVDELDQQLKSLILQAQRHPSLSLERQSALRHLVNGILQSGKLCHPQRGRFSGIYQEIYDEALQELLLYVCQNVEKYNPDRGTVMTWVNMLLERRFFREAIPRVMGQQDLKRLTLDDLDTLVSPENPPTLTEILQEWVDSDPDHLFRREHIEHQPEASFQALLKRRIAGTSWKEIATEFNLKIPTVSSFYYRCLTKYSTLLKQYCLDSTL